MIPVLCGLVLFPLCHVLLSFIVFLLISSRFPGVSGLPIYLYPNVSHLLCLVLSFYGCYVCTCQFCLPSLHTSAFISFAWIYFCYVCLNKCLLQLDHTLVLLKPPPLHTQIREERNTCVIKLFFSLGFLLSSLNF